MLAHIVTLDLVREAIVLPISEDITLKSLVSNLILIPNPCLCLNSFVERSIE